MRRLGNWCTTRRKTVIFGWIVALVVAGFAAGSAGSAFSENFKLPSSDSQRAVDLLEKRFPAQSGDTATIVYRAPSGVSSPAVRHEMSAAFAQIEAVPHVTEITSPYARGEVHQISANSEIAYATVQFDEHGNKIGKDNVERVIDIAQGAAGTGLQVELGGQPIEEVRQEEGDTSFAIGLLAAIFILLFTFGSVVAMGLPILTALFALGVGLSLVTLGTHVFDTADFATQLAAMIGLGVGIDYALFILTRFRNGLDEGLEPQPAAERAIDTAGRAVLFAGLTVIISLLGMLLLGVTFLYGVAVATALAVTMTMIASLTLLPALLVIAGRRVDRLRLPGLGKRRPMGEMELGRWYRWSAWIQRRPVIALLLSGSFLIALCIPALSLRLGSSDAGSDPASTTTRKAYDLLATGFGPGFNGPFVIVANLPRKGDDSALVALRREAEATPGVASATAPVLNPAKDVGTIQVYPTSSPQSEATTDLLHTVRNGLIPACGKADRRGRLRRRHHRDLRGLRQRPDRKAAALHRRRRAALGPAPDGGLPLGPGAAEGDADEPAQHHGHFRHRRRRLPVGLARRPDRARRDRPGRGLPPRLPLRDRLRPLDGLRGLPDVAHPRGMGGEPRSHSRRDQGAGPDRPRDHGRGGDHGHGLRLLHARPRPHHQALRPRPLGRRLDRRRRHPHRPRPLDHAALRRPCLVAAVLAAQAPAPDRGRAALARADPRARLIIVRRGGDGRYLSP
jgi:hypothetical protein